MIDQKSTLLHWFLKIRRSFGQLSIMGFLVTGGTGFIGSHLVQSLIRHKQRVVCLDNAPDPAVVACVASHVSVVQCDLDDREALAAVFRDREGIDRVVHLAYLMGAESEADPPAAMRVNALGTANLFAEACAHRVKRIVFTSSESVYGRSQAFYGDRPVREDDYCSPRDLVLNYSLTKLLNEHLAAKYEEKFGTEIVSLRIPIVYGPGRKRGTTAWASDFATLPAMGKPVRLPFPADDWNCYTYVEDVAEEIYALSTKPTLAHRVYNGGGHTVRACDLAALVRGIIPEAQINFTPEKPRSLFIYRMDSTRIRQELGFELRSMRDGIKDHISKIQQFHRAAEKPRR